MTKCYIKDYPRPQFVRKDWVNLNGSWDFCFDDANMGETEKWNKNFKGELTIQVPFTYETKLSGIQDEKRHDNIWYHRTFQADTSKLENNRLLIHFEGSDYITKVWVNGQYVGCHRGGYARFSFDITDVVKDGENELTVKVEDSYDIQQPRGKQRWLPHNFSCFYVQTTGIWKTVWLEYAPNIRLDHVKMTPNMQDRCLELEYSFLAPDCLLNGDLMIETVITVGDILISKTVSAITTKYMSAKIDMRSLRHHEYTQSVFEWDPKAPTLHDIEFRILNKDQVLDEVGSYCAMREILIEGQNILFNGRPLYQRLLLDQGYWKDSHLTPPSEEALIEDIDKILAMGYNGVRKHQKIEDERFLYWCDVKGLLVWSEAPAAYEYSDYAVAEFTRQWLEIVNQNYNHPCIITWTPFNESWGLIHIKTQPQVQHFTEAIYYLTKSIDKHRPVVTNDGWEHTCSDILTLHDYEPSGDFLKEKFTTFKDDILEGRKFLHMTALAHGFEYKGQPVIISEFGGIAFNNDDNGWGYGEKVNSKEEFIERFDKVTSAIKSLPYVCGYCYTQVTDIQQEINGLMDIDRNFKIDPKIIKEINERKPSIYSA